MYVCFSIYIVVWLVVWRVNCENGWFGNKIREVDNELSFCGYCINFHKLIVENMMGTSKKNNFLSLYRTLLYA